MRLNPDTRFGSLLLAVAARLLRWLFMGLGRSCKLDIVAGREHLEALLADPRPVILSFWHNRSFLCAHFLLDSLHRRGLDVTLLASHSRDGQLVVQVARRWGLNTVRGSASRGGHQALRGVYQAIVRKKSSPILIPDGPRGPLYQFKIGVVVLAQMSQAPILPLGFAAKKFWRIRSWDRMIFPLPFTRIALAVGAPQLIARQQSTPELEAERQRLQELLDTLTRQAEAAVGAIDSTRERSSSRPGPPPTPSTAA